MAPLQVGPIDDVEAHLEEDARQHRVGDLLREGPKGQHDGQQHQAVQHARQARAAAGANVDHGAHGGPGAGNAADEPGDGVTDALPQELLVGVVARARHIVRHEGGEQGVDGPEHREDYRRLQHNGGRQGAQRRHSEVRQPGRDIPDHRGTGELHADDRADDERRQWTGQVLGHGGGPEEHDQQGQGPEERRHTVDVGQGLGNGQEGVHRARRRLAAHDAGGLEDDDDAANAAHEARYHGIGHQANVGSQAQYAEEHLNHPGEHHGGKDQRRLIRKGGRKARKDHHHGPGRAGHVGGRAPKGGGKEAHGNGAVEPRDGAHAGGDPEGQGEGQGHHGGGEAAKNVSA